MVGALEMATTWVIENPMTLFMILMAVLAGWLLMLALHNERKERRK